MIKAENRTQTFWFLRLCSSHDPFGVSLLLYFVLIMVKIRHISAHDRSWLIISWIWLEQNSFSVRKCLRVNHYSIEIFLLPSTDPVTVTRWVSPVFFSALQGGVLQGVLHAHSSFWGSVEWMLFPLFSDHPSHAFDQIHHDHTSFEEYLPPFLSAHNCALLKILLARKCQNHLFLRTKF